MKFLHQTSCYLPLETLYMPCWKSVHKIHLTIDLFQLCNPILPTDVAGPFKEQYCNFKRHFHVSFAPWKSEENTLEEKAFLDPRPICSAGYLRELRILFTSKVDETPLFRMWQFKLATDMPYNIVNFRVLWIFSKFCLEYCCGSF